jgi:hypothetical protein
MQHELPLLPAGHDVQCPNGARGIVATQGLFAAAEEWLSFFVFDVSFVVNGAH